MALAYSDVGSSITDTAFLSRVAGGLVAQCIVVNNELASAANHVQRLQLLGRVVKDPATYAREFAPVICSVAPINGLATVDAATDAQILTGIQTVWDAFALQGI